MGSRGDRLTSPGPTALSLEDHRVVERNWRLAQGHKQTCKQPQASVDGALFQRFKAAREEFWAQCRQNSRRESRLVSASKKAVYEVSPDGNWALESIWFPADMCALENRFIFNLWTGEQLREADMVGWVTLEPPCAPAAHQPTAGSPTLPTDTSSSQQFAVNTSASDSQWLSKREGSFPNLQFNIGCHDEYDDDEPEPDYNVGCKAVKFCECPLGQPRGLYMTVDALRASRFSNTWDTVGRHWLYVLPSSPLEPVVREHLSRKLPLAVLQRVWALANSWPLAPLPKYEDPSER